MASPTYSLYQDRLYDSRGVCIAVKGACFEPKPPSGSPTIESPLNMSPTGYGFFIKLVSPVWEIDG